MSMYFNDCLAREYPSLLEEGFVSRAEFECIKDFHKALDGYLPPTNGYDHQAILDDPTWREITAKGRNSLQFLRALIFDPAEQAIFVDKPYAPALTAGDFSWASRPA